MHLPLSATLLISMLMSIGCTSMPASAPRSWLDERTAATVTAQSGPVVLAREEQMRAINVRDYAQLAAAEINRMGDRRLYLVLLYWSTIDRTAAEHERIDAGFSRVLIQADDRPIALTRIAATREQIGFGKRPFALPTPGAGEAYFLVTRSDLQSIAASRTLTLTTQGGSEVQEPYSEWQDGRPGLSAFIAQLP